ncbi:MAG: hypothetical protein LKK00_07400 [Intestinimonas sp.]|nr:hypothetical protein [Intestinimonas sp.]
MNEEPGKQDESSLQHQAEHEKPRGHRMPVTGYLTLLFAAAFLLLLLSYFMQLRANQETINGLKNSVTAMQSAQSWQDDKKDLEQKVADLEAQNDTLNQQLTEAQTQAQQAQASSALGQQQRDSLLVLNELETLVKNKHYSDARSLLEIYNSSHDQTLESMLTALDAVMKADPNLGGLTSYSPLSAYQSVSNKLS